MTVAYQLYQAVADDRSAGRDEAVQARNAAETVERDGALPQYLSEIHTIPLLSREHVAHLSRRIHEGIAARARLALGVEPAQHAHLERSAADGDLARQELIEANLRLVVSVAKKYAGRQLPLLDLIQEGNLGLMQAVERFDWRNGAAFSTYAYWWIRQRILRALLNGGRIVRLPIHVAEQVARVRRASHVLEQQTGQPPTAGELADACGMSEGAVRRLLAATQESVSLDQTVGSDADACLGDLIAGEGDEPDAHIVHDQLQADIHAALQTLSERQRSVLMLRYGVGDGRRRTLEEISRALGVSRERVRQIEADALNWLRRTIGPQHLESYRD